MKRSGPPQRRQGLKKGRGFAASKEQRRKVAWAECVVCEQAASDPAHVIPRSMGGCDHEDCVVPMCRYHHSEYDRGALDLLPFLEGRGYEDELSHAVSHVGLVCALERITNARWTEAA